MFINARNSIANNKKKFKKTVIYKIHECYIPLLTYIGLINIFKSMNKLSAFTVSTYTIILPKSISIIFLRAESFY